MKKYKRFARKIVCVLACTLIIIASIGCENKNTSQLNNSTENSVKKQLDGNEVKKKYEEGLQSLVSDSTITKEQADKILNSLITGADNLGEETKQKQIDNMNKLVNDKVITQDQANKVINVIEKIKFSK